MRVCAASPSARIVGRSSCDPLGSAPRRVCAARASARVRLLHAVPHGLAGWSGRAEKHWISPAVRRYGGRRALALARARAHTPIHTQGCGNNHQCSTYCLVSGNPTLDDVESVSWNPQFPSQAHQSFFIFRTGESLVLGAKHAETKSGI